MVALPDARTPWELPSETFCRGKDSYAQHPVVQPIIECGARTLPSQVWAPPFS